MGEEVQCGSGVSIEVAEHLEAQVERHDGVGHLPDGSTAPSGESPSASSIATRANSLHGRIRAATSAPSPGVDEAAGDHLDQHRDVAGVEVRSGRSLWRIDQLVANQRRLSD